MWSAAALAVFHDLIILLADDGHVFVAVKLIVQQRDELDAWHDEQHAHAHDACAGVQWRQRHHRYLADLLRYCWQRHYQLHGR